ncbi:hypothetical protein CO172_02830 [Candidatus Uhrbacteria bacterium CG_4_9_14_3_um_filter_36_7]|uniref:Uncharacterized protein n=1 Tax=Candidatus Uhrbacteria bacterium CG_4_9_14_3_um_filter_36_7 TaxID=1975033 RepID=A0A2M7XH21_9BACT|nr:MAG: hypothetical protein CO172_02830 [Candidatus Uhrbacteria bacterium CG_4_9_14_3_um_filter_36_7]
MRRAGYGELRNRQGQISYAARIGNGPFPRFHAYVQDTEDGGIEINLHLDQKEHNLGEGAAHAGEYEGPLLIQEMERLLRWIAYIQQENEKIENLHDNEHDY